MKLSKKGGGIAAAVVMAGGIAAVTTTSALAAPAGTPHASAAAKDVAKDKAKGENDADRAHAKHGRHARFLHGTHGEKTVKDKDGKTVTREWQVGKVTAATATSLTVTSSDGVSWTWTTSAQTRTHSPQHAAPKVGDEVLVEGLKSGTANDARVVVDPDQAKLAKWLAHHQDGKAAGKHDASKAGEPDHAKTPGGKHRKAAVTPAAPAPDA